MENKRITQAEFTKRYAERLDKRGVDKKIADKALKFILKTMMFNILLGHEVCIRGLGSFQIKESKRKRYDIQKNEVVDFCKDRFVFRSYRSLRNKIRKTYDH